MKELYTIGHSNYSLATFLSLLQQHDITILCDVRSQPYSKYHPQFTYQSLKRTLGRNYVFLGKELGGRPNDSSCYDGEGKIQYAKLAETSNFQEGIKRLKKGIESYRIALMCAEKDPLDCHRSLLICRHLCCYPDLIIKHILEAGQVETQTDLEQRLIKRLQFTRPDLLTHSGHLTELAYQIQSEKIAYVLREEEGHYEQNLTLHDRIYSEEGRTIF